MFLQNTCLLSLWQMSEQTQLCMNLRQSFSDIMIYQKHFFLTWEALLYVKVAWFIQIEIQLEHASSKHPKTVGVVESSHRALKPIPKLITIEQWNDWFKYGELATFIYHTSSHSATNCSPTFLFHGHEPVKQLDLRFNKKLSEHFSAKSEYCFALQDAANKKFFWTKFEITEMYCKNRAYYHCKVEAKPLALFSFSLFFEVKNQNLISILRVNRGQFGFLSFVFRQFWQILFIITQKWALITHNASIAFDWDQ